MKSVTQRVKEVNQPKGGYINPKYFEKIELEDNKVLFEEENIHASLVGLTVDYMTRYLNSENSEKAFKISLMGAREINQLREAELLLKGVQGLDDNSIINACKLVGYDVCYRAGTKFFKDVENINPDSNTIQNIRIMIERSLKFFNKYGPVIQDGITFPGGYTSIIFAGDADFTTEDTLWDFKVSKKPPTKDHTLQLIIYYLLGMHSYTCDFSKISKIGIYNPRKNIVYRYKIENIPKETIQEIETNVIGYNKQKSNIEELLTIKDLMSQMNCSRNMIMKYYTNKGLPLKKEKNKYVIEKRAFVEWLEEMKRKERELVLIQLVLGAIFVLLVIISYVIFI